MNTRWNRTNSRISGAMTMSVPAQISPHSEPDSDARVKDWRPTARRRSALLDVGTRAQRGAVRVAGRGHQGPEELVPVVNEAHHRERGEVRPDHGHQDVPEDPHPSGAVQHGGLVVLGRDAADALAEQ